MPLERAVLPVPGPRQLLADSGGVYVANAVVAFLFSCTGPVAIILSVAAGAGLSEGDIASWIFGGFFLNSLITIAFSLAYRQPLVFLWSIPGSVLLGPALGHLGFAEVVGAFLATGVLMLLLGLSGWVRRAMEAVPMPIVMAMVAGVFLRFGIGLVHSFRDDLALASSMTAAWLAFTAVSRIGRIVPPLIAALVVGVVVMMAEKTFKPTDGALLAIVSPHFYAPRFSWNAMVELVAPLAITVLTVQNAQGIAILTAAGHKPPTNAITAACGVGAFVTGLFGAVSTCLTGPVNAVITSAGEKSRHYTAALVVAALAMMFGLLAPLFTRLLLATPPAFIAALAGLAMLRVLQTAFQISFRDRFSFGALTCFLVTVADLPIFHIGAPFWGLVFGLAVSWLLERKDLERK
ncbi:MAG TPA: benzoate/H(+) symporter BenE family transporter [Burkholderiales bacterium]|nr:benzoate/H(+) symporter BenE family transporter [Burkholderiales bacterium]